MLGWYIGLDKTKIYTIYRLRTSKYFGKYSTISNIVRNINTNQSRFAASLGNNSVLDVIKVLETESE